MAAVVIIEYWLACYLGAGWLRLRKALRLRPVNAGLADACRQIAGGETVSATVLWLAQDFAVRVWWRAGMAAVLLIFPVIGTMAALRPGRAGTDVGVGVMSVLGCLVMVAMAQAGILRYRSDRTRSHLRTAGPGESLPSGSPGSPRKSDFWAMLAVSVAVCAILNYAGFHSGRR